MNLPPSRAVGSLALMACAVVHAQSISTPTLDAPAVVLPETCDTSLLVSPKVAPGTPLDVAVIVDEAGSPKSVKPVGQIADGAATEVATRFAFSCKYRPALSSGRPAPGAARFNLVLPGSSSASPPPKSRASIADIRTCAPTSDDYPAESRRLDETGTTRVRFTVSSNGTLAAFGVERSSGFLRLDFTALIKLAGCRFNPARDADGSPTSDTISLDYVWKLE